MYSSVCETLGQNEVKYRDIVQLFDFFAFFAFLNNSNPNNYTTIFMLFKVFIIIDDSQKF